MVAFERVYEDPWEEKSAKNSAARNQLFINNVFFCEKGKSSRKRSFNFKLAKFYWFCKALFEGLTACELMNLRPFNLYYHLFIIHCSFECKRKSANHEHWTEIKWRGATQC